MDLNAEGVVSHLYALDCGSLTMPQAFLMLGGSPELVEFPVTAFLVEHSAGLILFDAGLAFDAYDNDESQPYGHIAEFTGMKARPEQRIDRQLQGFGFKPDDVTHVVMSHLHFDHTGCLKLFSHAPIFLGEGELPFSYQPAPNPVWGVFKSDIEPSENFDWREVPLRDVDLFGDGAITMIPLQGHSPGHMGLQLRLPNGRTMVLAGDAGHMREQLSSPVPMPIDNNPIEAVSAQRLLRIMSDRPNTDVWLSHDPGDWDRYDRSY